MGREGSSVFLSQSLKTLAEHLKQELFKEGTTLFERRLVVVPDLAMKRLIAEALAFDERFCVAAGFGVVNLTQGYGKLTKSLLPSQMELALFLEYQVEQIWEDEQELFSYFENKEERLAPFCANLAQLFLRYATYGSEKLTGWQKRLWDEVEKRWSLPRKGKKGQFAGQIHLFGFSFLPKCYVKFFQEWGAKFYLFSPCSFFWGDYYSDKEKALLEKQVPLCQLDLFRDSFEDQNPLLANWGRVGRKMAEQIEELHFPTLEDYSQVEGDLCLQVLQRDIVEGNAGSYKADESLSFFCAPTKLRELQLLKDELLRLFAKKEAVPSDIQVFAPDISEYAPYLEAVFGAEELPIAYRVCDLEREKFDPVGRAASLLLKLAKGRFAKEDLFHLFRSPLFLEKFRLGEEEVARFEGWAVKANIRWGFSKEHRKMVYEQGALSGEIVSNPEEGSWKAGLNRLLLGLGEWEGEEQPLCLIDPTEMELFSKLYQLTCSLYDDLSPFFDQTCFTLSTWLRYVGCLIETYFAIDAGDDLYGDFQKLAASCDDLDQIELPFAVLEWVVEKLLTKKSTALQPSHLQTVSFGSLSEGATLPSKVICIIGLDEEAFPKVEQPLSLAKEELDYRPKSSEMGRYLFLQLLMGAKEKLILSYVQKEKLGASPLIEELLQLIDGAKIVAHTKSPFDPIYFEVEGKSYSPFLYQVARRGPSFQNKEVLIPSFYQRMEKNADINMLLKLDVQKWLLFARHPLRYYLQEHLGVLFPWKEATNQEYLLPFQTRSALALQALSLPVETVLKRARTRGELPLNLCAPLAKVQIAEEVKMWEEALDVFGIESEEVASHRVEASFSGVELTGTLDRVTPKGILVRSAISLEDKVALIPLAALSKHLGLGPLLSMKEKEVVELEASVEEHLAYFRSALSCPSPLSPTLVKPMLEGTEEGVAKALGKLKEEPDRAWEWLLMRDPLPSPEALLANWHEPLSKLFGGLCEPV